MTCGDPSYHLIYRLHTGVTNIKIKIHFFFHFSKRETETYQWHFAGGPLRLPDASVSRATNQGWTPIAFTRLRNAI